MEELTEVSDGHRMIDEMIITENNKEVRQINKEVQEIKEIMDVLSQYISIDQKNLDISETSVSECERLVKKGNAEIVLAKKYLERASKVKLFGYTIAGGVVFATVGSFAGPIGSIVGVCIGTGTGALFSRFI